MFVCVVIEYETQKQKLTFLYSFYNLPGQMVLFANDKLIKER